MRSDEELRLIEKLRKLETLFARPSTPGERIAAGHAADRIRQRLRQLERVERPTELRFSLPDSWSRALFVALLRRYGVEPYRYHRQRRTTVMARVTPTFAAEVLWPEFQQLHATLRDHLDWATNRVIREAIHGNVAEALEWPDTELRTVHRHASWARH